MCMHCTRREFLGTGALSGLALAASYRASAGAAASPTASSAAKVRICAIIAGKTEERSWSLSKEEEQG